MKDESLKEINGRLIHLEKLIEECHQALLSNEMPLPEPKLFLRNDLLMNYKPASYFPNLSYQKRPKIKLLLSRVLRLIGLSINW